MYIRMSFLEKGGFMPIVNCLVCNKPISRKQSHINRGQKTYCSRSCYSKNHMGSRPEISSILDKRLGEYDLKNGTNKYSCIREHARRTAFKENPTPRCFNCGYSKHVEVCHIKGIMEFSLESTVGEINNISNLVCLCPNCHWEFDHDNEFKQDILNRKIGPSEARTQIRKL